MDVIIEEYELCDAHGFFYATIPTLSVEIDIHHETSWQIASAEIIGCLRGETRTIRTFSPYKNAAEFAEINRDLMATKKDYFQGCVSEHLAESFNSRAANDADRRRNAFLDEMRPALV